MNIIQLKPNKFSYCLTIANTIHKYCFVKSNFKKKITPADHKTHQTVTPSMNMFFVNQWQIFLALNTRIFIFNISTNFKCASSQNLFFFLTKITWLASNYIDKWLYHFLKKYHFIASLSRTICGRQLMSVLGFLHESIFFIDFYSYIFLTLFFH